MRIASLTILCLALAAIPAWAQTYDNGKINGTTDAWTINFGYVVSDTFNWAGGSATSVSFGTWEFPGDTLLTVDFTISNSENGAGVGGTRNVTDKFISANQYGYNVDLITFNTGGVPLNAGTYWLNLYNAVVANGDPVFWDENSGKSSASESAVGTIPSEAFCITAGSCTPGGGMGGMTPEPSSIMLFGSGILGLAALLRRKLF
jgi:PEP-CTERM motif-containing protein